MNQSILLWTVANQSLIDVMAHLEQMLQCLKVCKCFIKHLMYIRSWRQFQGFRFFPAKIFKSGKFFFSTEWKCALNSIILTTPLMSYMLEESEAVSFDAPITWNINMNYKENTNLYFWTNAITNKIFFNNKNLQKFTSIEHVRMCKFLNITDYLKKKIGFNSGSRKCKISASGKLIFFVGVEGGGAMVMPSCFNKIVYCSIFLLYKAVKIVVIYETKLLFNI